MNQFYQPTNFTRSPADFYPTPSSLTEGLLVGLSHLMITLAGKVVLDPCAGDGAILRVLEAKGVPVAGADLHPESYPSASDLYASAIPLDATDIEHLRTAIMLAGANTVVTNTPYGDLGPTIAENLHALTQSSEITLAAALFPAPWDTAAERSPLLRSPHYHGRIVCQWRPAWVAGTKGGGKMNYVWHVWRAEPRAQFPHPASIYLTKNDLPANFIGRVQRDQGQWVVDRVA